MSNEHPTIETPFKIIVPEEKLSFLSKKLEISIFPDELENAERKYGVPLQDIQRLVGRWKNGFDWRKQEELLNKELPQFTRPIGVDGHGVLSIHYVHKKSEVENAIPLLFVHGWPGGFFEVRKVLPLLTASSPDHPSFHVVALSLPGFGFSDAPRKPGFAMTQYAEVGHKLMLALGYGRYVVQGGDWGHMITAKIAFIYGDKHARAWLTNFPVCPPPRLMSNPVAFIKHLVLSYSAADKAGLERSKWFTTQGSGYFAEQSTQPQTLGYSLADSPVGLLAWIYEKLVNWTDDYPWEDDEVLTWITLYWFSKAGPAASIRIYYEFTHIDMPFGAPVPNIPTGISVFPKELRRVPATWRSTIGKLVFASEHESGGHFAAHERPEELVSDLRKMLGKGGPAFGAVLGKNGY